MKKPIKLVDLYSERKESVTEDIFSQMRSVFKDSQFVLGKEVEVFEAAYAELAGCQYGIGLNSGTDALYLALRTLGIGSGHEVITVSNSFVATVGAIAVIGAKPVFVDVDEDFNMNSSLIEAAITPHTKAILPVHLTGNPCKMDEIVSIARKHKLFVIEDAAQAVGARFDGERVGSFGELGCFSLHPLKNLHVWGDGGMATTNSGALAIRLKQQRNHGLINRDEVDFFAFNSRLDTIQAVVGMASLRLWEETVQKRRQHAKIYDERLGLLEGLVQCPKVDRKRAEPVYHLYMITTKRRDKLMSFLAEDGIETKVHYPIPAHLQRAAQNLGYEQGALPVTEYLADHILSLPIRENLSEEEIHRVCDRVEQFYS